MSPLALALLIAAASLFSEDAALLGSAGLAGSGALGWGAVFVAAAGGIIVGDLGLYTAWAVGCAPALLTSPGYSIAWDGGAWRRDAPGSKRRVSRGCWPVAASPVAASPATPPPG